MYFYKQKKMKNLAGREVDKVPLGKSWSGGQLPGSGEAAGHHGCKERGFQLFYKVRKFGLIFSQLLGISFVYIIPKYQKFPNFSQ